MIRCILLLAVLSSCGIRPHPTGGGDLPLTKQKQKISFLQRKLMIAEMQQEKIQTQVQRLRDDVREAELAYIRGQIDDYEELIRREPKAKSHFDSAELFHEEREKLHRIIQSSDSTYEAQIVLDRILQLVTELGNDGNLS